MALSDRKLSEWAQPVSGLADKPQMSAAALKAAFDANTNQVKPALNGLIDDLQAAEAAGQLGFAATAGVQAGTVQAAIESVQQQVVNTALGEVPDGSIGRGKLTAEVGGELDSLHADLQGEIAQRAQVDAGLQSQIHTKAEIVVGTYTGNNEASRLISLGFTPRAVLVTDKRSSILESGYSYGGFAVTGRPAPGVEIAEGGFAVYYDNNIKKLTNSANSSSNPYAYIAIK